MTANEAFSQYWYEGFAFFVLIAVLASQVGYAVNWLDKASDV